MSAKRGVADMQATFQMIPPRARPTSQIASQKFSRPTRLLFTTALSLSLWYGLVQGTAFGYAQLRNLLEAPAQAAPGHTTNAPAPGRSPTVRPARPDADALRQEYIRRLNAIDPAVTATVLAPEGDAPAILHPTRSSNTVHEAVPNRAGVPDRAAPPPAIDAGGETTRDIVLGMLQEFGLVSRRSGGSMSDAELDGIVGGQAPPDVLGGAPGTGAEDEPDPQLDALNRVLVEGGGLLLPPWTVELQPEGRYSYKGANGLLITQQNGQNTVVAHSADITRYEAAITGRLGLPWRSQLELRVPYSHVSEESSVGSSNSDSSSSHGLGDIEVGLSHQFLRENGWVPDMIGEIRYRAPTGDDNFGSDSLPVGSGFHGVTGRVTVVKALDPVVFLGSAGYTANFEETKEGFKIDPGDSVEFGINAILAAGPRVSLRTGFGLAFTSEAKVDGDKIDGSDKTEGVLNVGGAVVLPGKNLLDLGVGVGVTEDAPDVAVRLALTHRF
ncbi:MAG: transporter [Geminicoccaceae bacterium]